MRSDRSRTSIILVHPNEAFVRAENMSWVAQFCLPSLPPFLLEILWFLFHLGNPEFTVCDFYFRMIAFCKLN